MNTTNTSRQILVIFLVFIFIASGYAVAAADFTPVGPQNMRGLFPIFNLPSLNFSSANSQICFGSICGNVTNFTSGTQYQADGVSTFLSGNSFSVNGTWVNNTIDSRVSSKLDVSDQRYNDTLLINSVSSNLQTNITLVNNRVDSVNATAVVALNKPDETGGWTNTSTLTNTSYNATISGGALRVQNPNGQALFSVDGTSAKFLLNETDYENGAWSFLVSFSDMFFKYETASNRSFMIRGKDNVDRFRVDLATNTTIINNTLIVTGLTQSGCDVKANATGGLYCGVDINNTDAVSNLASNLTTEINARINADLILSNNAAGWSNSTGVIQSNNHVQVSGLSATQGNFSQGIFINADNSNFSNPKNITFINTSTNESTAFLLDQNSGLIGHQGFQVELFGYGSLVLNGKTANVSIPGNRSNLNYATSVLSPSNNKALQVFGETNTSYLTIASATTANCDLKAYTNGTVYCGLDASGGSGSVTGTGLAGSIAVWVNSTHLGDNSNESVIMNFTNNSNTVDVDSAYSGFNFLKPVSASSFTGALIGSGAGITGLNSQHTHEAGNITPGHFTTGTYVLPGNLTVNGSLNEGLRIMRQTLDDFVLIRAPGGTVTAVSVSASDGTTSSDTMNIFTISGVVGTDGKFSATRGDILFQQDVFFDTGLQADGDVRVNGTFYVGTGTTAATSAVRADVSGNLVATTGNFTNINLNGRAFKPSPAYYRNNTWYSGRNGVADSASLTQTFSSNSNRAGAWVAKGTAKFDQLSVSITTASAGSVCIFGVYNASYNYSNGVWYPDKLLANTTQVNGSATGTFNYSVTPVQVVEGEVYFDVYNCNTGTTIRYAMLNVGAMEPILAEDTNTGSGNMFTLWADTDTHDGTLPATFQPENMVANSAMIALYKRMRTDI